MCSGTLMELWQCHWAANLLKAPFLVGVGMICIVYVYNSARSGTATEDTRPLPDIMKMMEVTFSKKQVASDIQQSVLLV